LFYKGYYHFFYQYNPKGVRDPFVQMHWGHSISTDLIHWEHLEIAMWPDKWYDEDGVWSGSATILKDGTPAIIYTGARNMTEASCEQSQNLAVPVDPTDPLLRQWKKADSNPLIYNPKGIKADDFRDPTSAWVEEDGPYRIAVGAKRDNADGTHDGLALLYKSNDFVHWELEKHLAEGIHTGMYECLGLYPIALKNQDGPTNRSMLKVETFTDKYKYVFKVGLQDLEQDHYAIGTYDTETHTFTVDNPQFDIGHGSYRYDYGKFYASKSFYDPETGRRIVWGWANESDSRKDQVIKGWASVQVRRHRCWGLLISLTFLYSFSPPRFKSRGFQLHTSFTRG
jgi:beta-fructofuranosidase